MTPEEREEFEERAAIMEFDGGMDRREAEQRAYDIIKKNRGKKKEKQNGQQSLF